MAQPSSSHHDRDRERERTDRAHRSSSSAHHHHRTISSTTLLLVLSLILAVLAVMLSIPSSSSTSTTTTVNPMPPTDVPQGIWGYLTPKRSQSLIAREAAVAVREAEVARREADLLLGSPAGANIPSSTILPACSHPEVTVLTRTITVEAANPPIQTVVREVVKEIEQIAAPPPPWTGRLDDLLERETRISDREKDVGKREETVGRRESDASRREAWIMDQLIALGNEDERPTIEEEIVYETIPGKQQQQPRKPKVHTFSRN